MSEPTPGRPVSASEVEMTQLVQPPDTNYLETLFGGRLVEWIDTCAAIAARRHARLKVVTASIDDLHFAVAIRLGDVVVLRARVNGVHRTSMEVGVRVERECPRTGERQHAARAYLTFVALSDDNLPQPVPPLLALTPEDVRRAANALTRRRFRLMRREALATRDPEPPAPAEPTEPSEPTERA